MGRVNYPPRLDVADTLGNRSSYQAEARNAAITPRVQNLSNAAAMLRLPEGDGRGEVERSLCFFICATLLSCRLCPTTSLLASCARNRHGLRSWCDAGCAGDDSEATNSADRVSALVLAKRRVSCAGKKSKRARRSTPERPQRPS